MCRRLKVNGYGGREPVSILLDDADYDLLSQWSWQLSAPDGYPRRTVRKPEGKGFTTLYMHQVLLGKTDHREVIDHRNGDKRDY